MTLLYNKVFLVEDLPYFLILQKRTHTLYSYLFPPIILSKRHTLEVKRYKHIHNDYNYNLVIRIVLPMSNQTWSLHYHSVLHILSWGNIHPFPHTLKAPIICNSTIPKFFSCLILFIISFKFINKGFTLLSKER